MLKVEENVTMRGLTPKTDEVLHLMGLGAKDFVEVGGGLWQVVR